MTTLIDRVVGVAGVCSYTCKLGTFFVMPLTLPIPIFEKISLRGALEKSVKLWVLHKNDFLCNTRFLSNFSRAPCRDIFSKIGMDNVRGTAQRPIKHAHLVGAMYYSTHPPLSLLLTKRAP